VSLIVTRLTKFAFRVPSRLRILGRGNLSTSFHAAWKKEIAAWVEPVNGHADCLQTRPGPSGLGHVFSRVAANVAMGFADGVQALRCVGMRQLGGRSSRGRKQNRAFLVHHFLKRAHRLLAPDEQREDHSENDTTIYRATQMTGALGRLSLFQCWLDFCGASSASACSCRKIRLFNWLRRTGRTLDQGIAPYHEKLEGSRADSG